MTEQRPESRGRFWPILFAVIGVLALVDYFYKSSYELSGLLKGVGFLLASPQAYFHPTEFTKPLKVRNFKPRLSNVTDWLALVGAVLLMAGIIVEWL
ncbi:hypothetical protein [Stenotrophomonas acidaminiphila]|uniref:hypothetical protein n=1 Tax=Stenotrophomonas acidaminiphila TaxID=128780 RepID=UPI0020C60AF4|nr:hypothetical protein [Stenotrophomonas acidaminiphila]